MEQGVLSHNADLSAGTVITKETKEPNMRVLLGALLFGFIVSFVVCNLCLGTYIQKLSYATYSIEGGVRVYEYRKIAQKYV